MRCFPHGYRLRTQVRAMQVFAHGSLTWNIPLGRANIAVGSKTCSTNRHLSCDSKHRCRHRLGDRDAEGGQPLCTAPPRRAAEAVTPAESSIGATKLSLPSAKDGSHQWAPSTGLHIYCPPARLLEQLECIIVMDWSW